MATERFAIGPAVWRLSSRELVRENRDKPEHLITFFNRFFKHSSATKLRDLLQLHVPTLLVTHGIAWKASAPSRVAVQSMAGLLSATEANERFRICKPVLARLRVNGRSLRAKRSAKHGVTLYDADQLENSIKLLRNSLSADQCCKTTGAVSQCLPSLARRGFLTSIEDADALLLANGQLFDPRSVDRFTQLLLEVPVSGTGNSRRVDLFRRQFHPKSCVDAIEALLDGRLRAVQRDDNNLAILKRFWVDEAEATAFSASLPARSLPDETVSFAAAGRILGLNEVDIGYVFRAELYEVRSFNQISRASP